MTSIHDSDEALVPGDQNPMWFLEGYSDSRGVARRIPIQPIPFQVGRNADLPLPLNFSNISRVHAELYFDGECLMVRDLDSRNGTFVNRHRISEPAVVQEGDVLHFGAAEFRIGCELDDSMHMFSETCEFQGVLPEQFAVGTREFLEMIRQKAVIPCFQPLVRMRDRQTFAYELLGRGGWAGAPTSAPELFHLAASCSMEGELSRLFRAAGIKASSRLSGTFELFVNVHPTEMKDLAEVGRGFAEISAHFPRLQITVEIHESLVTNPAAMLDFRSRLIEHSIKIAYDDFGAGQARLIELAEAPPDYLKFDRSLVERIHEAPKQRQQMVQMLVKYAVELGVTTLAEGIETAEEAKTCQELGFECAQGFYFGRPEPVGDLTAVP